MHNSSFVRWLSCAVGVLSLAVSLPGQCTPGVVVEGTFPDADNTVYASQRWDPDLSGPAPEVVVFGGSFRLFGDVAAAGLVAYDPVTRACTPLLGSLQTSATGVASIRAVAVAPNNELVVAGRFTSVDGVLANNVARWNGAAWQPMGAGVALGAAGACEALLVLANGEILAGGGGVQRWNGVSWSPLGSLGNVGSLVQMPNGDVVAAGTLVLPGGQHLARWDGTSWSSFGTSPDGGLSRLKVAQNGDLLVVGGFVSVAGQPIAGIARYDGVTWQGLGGGMFNPVDCVEELPNGDLVAGGRFVAAGGAPGAGGTPADQVARWNGTSWLPMGTGLAAITPNSLGPVRTLLALPGGELVAGGDFQPGGGNAGMNRVARWNGASWSSLRPGTAGAVLSTVETSSGQRYAVGSFAVIEGVVASRVAVRTNGVWQPLGSGANNTVHAVLPLPNGDLVIGGAFTEAGGVPCNRVALWDGSSWSALGAGLPATVRSLAVDAQGQVLALGDFLDQVAVWNGQAWNGTGVAPGSSFPTGGSLRRANAGDVIGSFGGRIARWTGLGWSQVVTGAGPQFGELSNGDLVAAGSGTISRWNGSTWIPYPSLAGLAQALLVLPNDDLLVAMQFGSNPTTSRLHRWNGVAWSLLGETTGGSIAELRWRLDGSVSVCGGFRQLFGVQSAAFARLATNCPAAVASAGTGCTGAGGSNTLTATSSPWAGSTFTSRAAGLLPGSLAIEVLGLSALSTPLAALLPQGGVGCSLLASPDVLRAYVVPGAQLDLAIAIPDSTAWIGSSLRQQLVPVELDAAGAIQALTATPALALTIGRF